MKLLFKSGFLLGLCFTGIIATIAQENILSLVGNAIKSGNSKEVSNFFDQNVEITLLDEEGLYSKAQAEQIIKGFFATNIPKSFSQMHEGSSKEGSRYGIGTLTTTKNMSFRTYYFVKLKGGKYYIQELRFEEE